MSKTVPVDLDDLKALVFSTGVIKTIEGALTSFKQDPFANDHPLLKGAHDRLASAMRNAERASAGTLVGWNDPLTDEEVGFLKEIIVIEDVHKSYKTISVADKKNLKYDGLAAKGCIIIGQLVVGIVWAGAERAEIRPDPSGYAVKITARGREREAQHVAATPPPKTADTSS